jgi:hypothetical protein
MTRMTSIPNNSIFHESIVPPRYSLIRKRNWETGGYTVAISGKFTY